MSSLKKRFFLFLMIFLLATLIGCAKPPVALKPVPEKIPRERPVPESGIEVFVNGERVNPLVPTLFLLPEEPLLVHTQKISLSLSSGLKTESWSVLLNEHLMTVQGNNLFSGKAPKEPGLYDLEIECRQIWTKTTGSQNLQGGEWEEIDRQSLLVIVLHPSSQLKDGFIGQYPMGFYPDPEEAPAGVIPKTAYPQYLPPKGFIEVTPENQERFVSRHYCLKDFICHYKTSYPYYMALSPALLVKLELLTLKLRQNGMPEARLNILSGFRTPWYNQTVTRAKWSRHIYGDAVDITLDPPTSDDSKAKMNPNGLDQNNFRVMVRLIEEIEEETGLVGGLGVGENDAKVNHFSFIHMDTRGFKARW
jgi:hypothetical protein